MFHAHVNKDVLPKIGQGLKLNRKLSEIYSMCVGKGHGDIGLLTHIYGPSQTLSHAIYAEVIYITHSYALARTLTLSYVSTLASLRKKDSRARSIKFSTPYLSALADMCCSNGRPLAAL